MKKQFFNEVTKLVALKLGTAYRVTLEDVEKNNGLMLKAIVISKVNSALGVNIYMDDFYPQYKKGRSLENISEEILEKYLNHAVSEINTDCLNDKTAF